MCQLRIKICILCSVSQHVLRALLLAQAELLSISEHFNAVCTRSCYFR